MKFIIGINKLEIKEDRDEYLKIKKITNQINPKQTPK